MKKIRVIIKRAGEPCEVAEIENTLEEKQKIVGGYIEVVPYDENAIIICNEEGKLLGLKPNCMFDFDYIAGDFIVAGDDYENGDFKSLTKKDIKRIVKDLNRRSFTYKTEEE